MSIYLRGDVWYYLFYVNGRRYRGSTQTKNKKQAERSEPRARVAAEAGESLHLKRAPLIQDFAKQFLEWLDKTTLEQKTKNDYRNGVGSGYSEPLIPEILSRSAWEDKA
jgi:hypothetical protein